VLEANALDDTRRRQVLDYLSRRYWKPVYCYLRRKGHDDPSAKDLTQGFFQELILEKDIVRRANPQRGRFRTFLLTALDNYVVSSYHAAMRRKRHPGRELQQLDGCDDYSAVLLSHEMEPHDLFTYVWATTLLDEVLAEVERGCTRDGKKLHWQLFRVRVFEPIVTGDPPPSFRELCQRFDVKSELAASNMIVTVKRRFKAVLEQMLREQVNSDADVDGELGCLVAALGKGGPV
jgi:RNA polymerase sigma-70 factor (ECF subfamily)